MPFVKFDVEEEIKRQCEKSPEFKKLWEEHCAENERSCSAEESLKKPTEN